MTGKSTKTGAIAALAAVVLTACNAGERPNPEARIRPESRPASLIYCPPTLAYIRDDLVTPEDRWDAFLGPGVMQKTLSKPIDEMIVEKLL